MEMVMVIVIVATALIMTLLALVAKEDRGFFSLFASIMWFVSAASVSVIHKPYSYVVENTSGEYEVLAGTQKVTQNWPMTALFIGLGLFCLFLFFMHYVDKIKEWLRGSGYGSILEKGGY